MAKREITINADTLQVVIERDGGIINSVQTFPNRISGLLWIYGELRTKFPYRSSVLTAAKQALDVGNTGKTEELIDLIQDGHSDRFDMYVANYIP